MAANCWPLLMLTVLVDSYYSSRTIFQQENMQYFFHESFLHNHKDSSTVEQKQYEMKKKYANVIKKWKTDEEEKKCQSLYNCDYVNVG
ncbi:hypothetical protein T06_16867 [Trichinella sp. T6]|nr:hypothetical protein T06_16867 [Trichinella sp. T6]